MGNFVGFKNFSEVFRDYEFWRALSVTTVFVVTSISIQFFIGLGTALLFSRGIKTKKFFRTVLTMPLFTTPIALGYLGRVIFGEYTGGIIRGIFTFFHLPEINWISDPFWAPISIISLEVWQWTPFCFLVLLAGLQSLPKDMYEASAIDGASEWQNFWYISLPLLKFVIMTLLILRFLMAWRVLGVPLGLTGGGPGTATQVYSLLVYRVGLNSFNFGYGSALAYVFFIMIMVSTLVLFTRIRGIFAYRH